MGPEYGAAISAGLNRPDVKERRSASLKAAWARRKNSALQGEM
jgi:hypothetical protein